MNFEATKIEDLYRLLKQNMRLFECHLELFKNIDEAFYDEKSKEQLYLKKSNMPIIEEKMRQILELSRELKKRDPETSATAILKSMLKRYESALKL